MEEPKSSVRLIASDQFGPLTEVSKRERFDVLNLFSSPTQTCRYNTLVDIPAHHHKAQLTQLIYCSRSRIDGTSSEKESAIQVLLQDARKNNAAEWISGVLLYNGTTFAQVLEGPSTTVERRFQIIRNDVRHTSVVVVSRESISRRVFSSWAMAYLDATSVRNLSESTIDLQSILETGKSRPGFVLNLLRDVMATQEQA